MKLMQVNIIVADIKLLTFTFSSYKNLLTDVCTFIVNKKVDTAIYDIMIENNPYS